MQKNSPVAAKRFWVLGAGRFGQLAVKRILASMSGVRLTVVDNDPPAFDPAFGLCVIQAEAVRWLFTTLDRTSPVDLIIPAIPVHVAFEWLRLGLEERYDIQPLHFPDSWLARLPHAKRGAIGQVFASHADFLCPDNCPEPKNRCTVTGKQRPRDLFRLFRDLSTGDTLSIVVRSRQLLPGVGGLAPKDLVAARRTVLAQAPRSLLLATACRCHGVANAVCLGIKGKSTAGRCATTRLS